MDIQTSKTVKVENEIDEYAVTTQTPRRGSARLVPLKIGVTYPCCTRTKISTVAYLSKDMVLGSKRQKAKLEKRNDRE